MQRSAIGPSSRRLQYLKVPSEDELSIISSPVTFFDDIQNVLKASQKENREYCSSAALRKEECNLLERQVHRASALVKYEKSRGGTKSAQSFLRTIRINKLFAIKQKALIVIQLNELEFSSTMNDFVLMLTHDMPRYVHMLTL